MKIRDSVYLYNSNIQIFCLQVDYIEHANNNTLKTILALKYIFSLNWDSKFPEFVMKSDDDIYINIPLLSQLLFSSEQFRWKFVQRAFE